MKKLRLESYSFYHSLESVLTDKFHFNRKNTQKIMQREMMINLIIVIEVVNLIETLLLG